MAENKPSGYPEEEMYVDIVIDDKGTVVNCEVITIFEVCGADYVALQPKSNPLDPEQEVWFFRYSENPDDPNEEPILGNIDDDQEYEIVLDAFEEYLDDQYFDEV